jgi:hypothetical protein
VIVPPYGQSRQGRVFRLLRSSRLIAPGRVRYALRAVPLKPGAGFEASRELDINLLLDKAVHRQAVPTPEQTFEDLWQQLRLDIDLHSDQPPG